MIKRNIMRVIYSDAVCIGGSHSVYGHIAERYILSIVDFNIIEAGLTTAILRFYLNVVVDVCAVYDQISL